MRLYSAVLKNFEHFHYSHCNLYPTPSTRNQTENIVDIQHSSHNGFNWCLFTR